MAAFQNDVFVSYSHIDIDWVPEVHQELERHLRVHLGRPARIWRDRKLGGADDFSDELTTQLAQTAVLVCVMSPGYLGSEWCARELREFMGAAERSGGLKIGNKLRLVKLERLRLPLADLPPAFERVLGFEFYRSDPDSGRDRPLRGTDFDDRLDDVAREIAEILQALSPRTSGPAPAPARRSVFLAESTSDRRDDRTKARNELEAQRYHVLPAGPLPADADDLAKVIGEDLDQCALSIHLFGAPYGLVPEGTQQSIVELQHQVAVERGLPRVVWIPPGLEVQDPRQLDLLGRVRDQTGSRGSYELVEGPFESLTTIILDKLRQKEKPTRETSAGSARIYVICDQRDRQDVRPVRDYLLSSSFEPILPLGGGDVSQHREDHQENLQDCDAVLLYWGHGDEFWMRTKMRDLVRVRGLGRPRGFEVRPTIYVTAPASEEKQDLATNEAQVIRHFAPFHPDVLQPFVAELHKRLGAGA